MISKTIGFRGTTFSDTPIWPIGVSTILRQHHEVTVCLKTIGVPPCFARLCSKQTWSRNGSQTVPRRFPGSRAILSACWNCGIRGSWRFGRSTPAADLLSNDIQTSLIFLGQWWNHVKSMGGFGLRIPIFHHFPPHPPHFPPCLPRSVHVMTCLVSLSGLTCFNFWSTASKAWNKSLFGSVASGLIDIFWFSSVFWWLRYIRLHFSVQLSNSQW